MCSGAPLDPTPSQNAILRRIMRTYSRVIPRFADSQPVWIAAPLMVLWGVLAIFFFICLGVWIVARFVTQQAQRGWRMLQSRRGD